MSELHDLRQKWLNTFGCSPKPTLSREFMVANLGYHQQCQLHGGLNPKTYKQLMAIARDGVLRPNTRQTQTRPGTKLIRMWQGEPHEVTIMGFKSYQYRNQTYTSLSAIATAITGTAWNGHVFFGLRK